ncbi:glycosyltransferase family 4 protein [Hujiaoplasma nucleasis]|uniref:Glycosyltransferase family 4 protein n=1 Tax=Hujiaoplasma nucleasis TaxID=2725268 RepID=A0A7L6N0P0_9MOLU|nr:hypothetical protein [Hujiaoplasma nucleasis]QLY39820.1 glycosyltransferase family 4 protein [Hujiaoplasma nucleasis]
MKILFISSTFAPQNAIGTIRISKLIKYFVRQDVEVTLITKMIPLNSIIDNNLLCIEHEKINIFRVGNFRIFSFLESKYQLKTKKSVIDGDTKTNYKNNIKTKKNIRSIFKKTIKKLYFFIEHTMWIHLAKKKIKKFKKYSFDYVISSSPRVFTHDVAKYSINKKIAKKWIAEFRDPIVYEYLGRKKNYDKLLKLQNAIINKADKVTTVSSHLKEKLLNTSRFCDNKFEYIPNGYDLDDMMLIKKKNINNSNLDKIKLNAKLKLVYSGSLYDGKRDVSIIFKIINKLINKEVLDTEDCQFIYMGHDFEVLYGQAKEYNVESILLDLNYVTRTESINIQNLADFVIISTWNTKNDVGVVPGKIYEAFMLRKRIIAVINGSGANSEVSKMIKKANIGVSLDESNDFSENILEEFLFSYLLDNQYNILNESYLNEFDYSVIIKKYLNLM